jgi:hypothetical protein
MTLNIAVKIPKSLVLGAAAIAIAILSLSTLARGEVSQRGNVRVTFEGKISPRKLPRQGSAPVKVAVSAEIVPVSGRNPPRLRRVEIEINRHGHLDPTGLPVCKVDDIQPSTTEKALEACGRSLVGRGRFSAKVLLPEQSPFPSRGRIYAFNGTYRGRPAVLAHVYGTDPAPTSVTLPFTIIPSKGTFATILTASLPQVTSEWGYVTGLSMTLQRRYSYRGKARSYATAGCPAPKGFPGTVFPFARATFSFKGSNLSSTLTRTCKTR